MRDVDDIPREELGVELDTAMDRKLDAENSIHTLKNTHGRLYTAADGELPTSPEMEIRYVQEDVQDIIDALESEVDVAESRIEAVRERIRE